MVESARPAARCPPFSSITVLLVSLAMTAVTHAAVSSLTSNVSSSGNNGTEQWQSSRCATDRECQQWDDNLICESGVGCVCAPGFRLDSLEQLCRVKESSLTWALVISLLPLLMVGLFCLSCVRLARTTTGPPQTVKV